eukprot:GHVS01061945.1.p1 GENE.GHVS01061945.1~~GHVS01061945.1.p1  ORF type:complete len:139 (-),score=41.98 GHVS01061945.1:142-558(-)
MALLMLLWLVLVRLVVVVARLPLLPPVLSPAYPRSSSGIITTTTTDVIELFCDRAIAVVENTSPHAECQLPRRTSSSSTRLRSERSFPAPLKEKEELVVSKSPTTATAVAACLLSSVCFHDRLLWNTVISDVHISHIR